MSTGFTSTELALKIRVYVLHGLAVVSDCTGARVENDIRNAKQYTHTHTHTHTHT